MIKEITTSGMIIKEIKVGEGNKIFTILTAEHGKIQASGAGVRSYKSKLSAGCSLFCYSEFILKKSENRDLYTIVSAEKKMDFFDIRYDIQKLALVNYICELVNNITVQENDCSDILRLLLNTVYYIQKTDVSDKVKPVFELRLMCETGFSPNLTTCHKCGNKNNLYYFSVDAGSVECSLCKKSTNISEDVLQAMKFICSSPQNNIFSFEASEYVIHQLTIIAEQYILTQLGNTPKSLYYLKSI